jgi:hypothetical protein
MWTLPLGRMDIKRILKRQVLSHRNWCDGLLAPRIWRQRGQKFSDDTMRIRFTLASGANHLFPSGRSLPAKSLMRSSTGRSAQRPVDGLQFFFSFEFVLPERPKKPRLAGARRLALNRRKNLLLSAVSLCRMVLRGLEYRAAPPHRIGQRLAGNGDDPIEAGRDSCSEACQCSLRSQARTPQQQRRWRSVEQVVRLGRSI